MRILIATTYASIVGGAETYLRSLIPELANRNCELAVLAQFPPAPGSSILERAPQVPIWMTGETGRAVDWKPDIVYSQGMADAGIEAELTGRFPSVLYAHNYDGTCVSGNKCHSAPGMQTCSRRLGPACLALYLPRRCGGRNPITALKLYRTNRRRQSMLPRYGAVLVASRHMAAELVRNGAPESRVHRVPYPVESTPDALPPVPRPPGGRLLFVGRITALKGWSHLLEAIPRASAELGRPLSLTVAGVGPDLDKFRAEAERRNLSVEFLGWVDSKRRQEEMRRADLLVVPSVWPEPFGMVGVEAGCVGLPAAAYAVGGIPDWLIPGVSGELAPGGRLNPRELADAIVRAIREPDHWQKLRIATREVSRRFSVATHMDSLLPLLGGVADPRNGDASSCPKTLSIL